MKKFIYAGALAFALALTACSSDDGNGTNGGNENVNPTQGTVTAKINGQDWTATSITNVRITRVPQMGQQRFDIAFENEDNKMYLACSSELTESGMPVRSYTFEDGDALFMNYYIYGNNSTNEHATDEGTFTITSIDEANKKISGTFEYKAHKIGSVQNVITTPENVEVTQGVFTNLSYTE